MPVQNNLKFDFVKLLCILFQFPYSVPQLLVKLEFVFFVDFIYIPGHIAGNIFDCNSDAFLNSSFFLNIPFQTKMWKYPNIIRL